MIENREQRKKASLFRRRVIIICVSAVLFIAIAITLSLVYNFVNTVVYYTDAADNTVYHIKKENDKWAMYDTDGNLLEVEDNFGYFVTKAGTLVEIHQDTGKYYTRAVPEISDGELTEYEKVLIFKHISQKDIRSIEIHNANDSYTFWRYNIDKKKVDDKANFVFRGSPQLTIRKDALTALASDAGYPLATNRVDNPMKLKDGKIDFSEYGLVAEKRTRTVIDDDGNEIEEEYDYTPAYYILTDTAGNQYKMIIGDRLINGGGYYAQYVEIKDGKETPRNKVYILASSISSTLLAEAKNFITAGIAYPTTQSDYYKVTDFEIKKLDSNSEYEKLVGFTFIDIAERTDTVRGNKPYIFNDDRSKSYYPDFDKIDVCLLNFMEPTIIDIAELHPSNKTLADEKYGLMKKVVDENGDPVLDEKGNEKYVFASKYVVSAKRETTVEVKNTTSSGTETTKKVKLKYLQTIYISEKNENGNYYSYTTISILDDSEIDTADVDLDMICEVSGSTYNFLNFTKNEWTYPAFMETGIKYATKLELSKPGYSVSFGINNITEKYNILKDNKLTEETYNAISITATDSKGNQVSTFGMLNVRDASNEHRWYVSRTDVKLFDKNGKELFSKTDMKTELNAIGEKTKYLTKPFLTADGRQVYVNLNDIKIVYPDNRVETYVRYQTMIFQKLFQGINSLRIAGEYSPEDEAALISNPDNLYATMSLTNNENETITAKFYSVTSRKLYVVVNGEGGYYVSTADIDTIFENVQNFYDCKDINIEK